MKRSIVLKVTVELDIIDEAELIATATTRYPEVIEGFDLDGALQFLLSPDVEDDLSPGAEVLEVTIEMLEGVDNG